MVIESSRDLQKPVSYADSCSTIKRFLWPEADESIATIISVLATVFSCCFRYIIVAPCLPVYFPDLVLLLLSFPIYRYPQLSNPTTFPEAARQFSILTLQIMQNPQRISIFLDILYCSKCSRRAQLYNLSLLFRCYLSSLIVQTSLYYHDKQRMVCQNSAFAKVQFTPAASINTSV